MSGGDEREDLLGILRKYRPIYFAVFIAQVTAWCIAVSWWEVTSGGHASGLGSVIAIGLKMAPLSGLSIFTTIVTVDIGRYLVVFLPTPNVRRRIREEARAEERRKWVEWNRRRKEAEAQGLPFEEPPPGESEAS